MPGPVPCTYFFCERVKGCTEPESTLADSLRCTVFFNFVVITGSPTIQAVDFCRSEPGTDGRTESSAVQGTRAVRLSNNIPDEAQEDSPGDEKSCSLRRR